MATHNNTQAIVFYPCGFYLLCFLWPPYGIEQAIIFLSCGFFYVVSFSLAYSDLPQIGCTCGLSANLGCRSETCCTRLAGNAGRKKIASSSPSTHHCTTLSGDIFATKARIDNREKLIKQQYLLVTRPGSYDFLVYSPSR